MADSFHGKYIHIFFCCETPFRETSRTVEKTENVRKHVLIQSFSSICENLPHLEYSGGQSFTSVGIHDTTSDGELKGQEV